MVGWKIPRNCKRGGRASEERKKRVKNRESALLKTKNPLAQWLKTTLRKVKFGRQREAAATRKISD